jgi:methionyl-tRNA formyltransferase
MNIMLAGYNTLIPFLHDDGHHVINITDPIEDIKYIDLIISYGYRHIISSKILEQCPAINLHISYLPYGRGAHPLFWALYDAEPIGISIHLVDNHLDTGPIFAQKKIVINEKGTLATEYMRLQEEMVTFFKDIWPTLDEATPQEGTGSYHKSSDLIKLALPLGWNTPVSFVRNYGMDSGVSEEFYDLRREEILNNNQINGV